MKKIFQLIIMMVIVVIPSIAKALENTTWQNDWTFATNNTSKTITLTKYKGSEEEYKIPSKAIINDTEYSVILGNSSNSSTKPFANTSIKKLSVEEGVTINNPNYLFYQATNLENVDLSGANTSNATTVQGMFYGATNIKKVSLKGLNFGKVTNVQYMFYQSSAIEEIDLSDVDFSKITTFAYSSPDKSYASAPFMGMTKLKKINMRNLNTAELTTAERMFMIQVGSYDNQNNISEIDVTNWNTSKVTKFYETFAYCGNNNEITIKGLETLDVSNAKDFAGMFMSGINIADLTGVEKWNMSSATNVQRMFSECESIKKLDLSAWNTSNITNMSNLFLLCKSLENINVSNWDTSKVNNMQQMFKGCSSLKKLDIGSWTSDAITAKYNMYEMFGAQRPNSEYPLTPLEEITLNENFKFIGMDNNMPPSLRSGYWQLKEGTAEEKSKKFTAERLYNAYNNGITPPDGYSHSHTYVLAKIDPANYSYYGHGWGDNNVWEVHYPEDKFKAYCINLHRGSPSGYYDRTKVNGNSIVDDGFLDSNNYGHGTLGSNMMEALITLIYYGWGNDADKIQEKYNLTDSEYMLITQQAIWDYTDRYNNISERDKNTNSGKAYYELVSKKFSDIPNGNELTLYLYESIDGKQNLLSISGLSNVAHAGVRVLKLGENKDGELEPLIGAEFTIYDDNNKVVGTITSDDSGYATKYNTDSIYGLPEGIYKIRETKAPRGYKSTNNYYSFIVRKNDDDKIITLGKLKETGDNTSMIFENTLDNTVEGGGLIIKVVDSNNKPVISGTKFAILDENGNKIDEVVVGNNGTFKTGKKDLVLNKNYTAKLIEAPKGYVVKTTTKSANLTKNEEYETLIFTLESKKGNVEINATKKYNKDLNSGDFNFVLTDINNNVVARASNDEKGNIKFNLSFDANSLGYVVYKLQEEKGDNDKITYDEHSEEIIVYVSDLGDDKLDCKVEYQSDNVSFSNTFTEEEIDPPKEDDLPEVNPEKPNNDFPKTGVLLDIKVWIILISVMAAFGLSYYFITKKLYSK